MPRPFSCARFPGGRQPAPVRHLPRKSGNHLFRPPAVLSRLARMPFVRTQRLKRGPSLGGPSAGCAVALPGSSAASPRNELLVIFRQQQGLEQGQLRRRRRSRPANERPSNSTWWELQTQIAAAQRAEAAPPAWAHARKCRSHGFAILRQPGLQECRTRSHARHDGTRGQLATRHAFRLPVPGQALPPVLPPPCSHGIMCRICYNNQQQRCPAL